MADILEIAQLGNPVLRQMAEPVHQIQADRTQALIDQLMATLLHSNGVGIAAPQVAQPYQVLIVASRPNPRYPTAPQMDPTVMINPRLLGHSDEVVKDWEGCLSIPGIRGLVPRYRAIEVEYTTRQGHLEQRALTDFVARIFQHEFDHLHGMVFLDRVESVQEIVTDQEYLKRIIAATPRSPHSTK